MAEVGTARTGIEGHTAEQERGGGGIMQRIKDTLGLTTGREEGQEGAVPGGEATTAGGTEEYAVSARDSASSSPTGTVVTAAEAPSSRASSQQLGSPRISVTKLLKPQEVEAGVEPPPQLRSGEEAQAESGRAAGEAAVGEPAACVIASSPGRSPAPPAGAGNKPAEKVLADLGLAGQVAQRAQQRAQHCKQHEAERRLMAADTAERRQGGPEREQAGPSAGVETPRMGSQAEGKPPGGGNNRVAEAPQTPAASAHLPARTPPPPIATTTAAAAPARSTAASEERAVSAPEGGMTPAQAAAARLEQMGARRGRISGGAIAEKGGAAADKGEKQKPEVGAPPEPKQGGRVKVGRLQPGPGGPAAGGGGMPQVEVRPDHEVGAMTSAEVARVKAREHEIQANEREQVMQAKGQQLHQLRGQAELLEVQTEGLLAEASQDKLKRDQLQKRKGQFEKVEWHNYAEAEQAEKQRRKVVVAARPAAERAEGAELEALRLRQLAADTEFHGEVLERKARALVQESQEMADLALEKQAEAERLAAELLVKRQEQQEWQQKVDMVTAGDLPQYIHECEAEIGRLAHRISELRDEIDWARGEMDKLFAEGGTWQRVLHNKQSEAALLLLRMEQAREEADAARVRAHQAAEEALEPTSLAEVKYEEAYRLQQQAEEYEGEAQQAQEEVLQVVQQAVGPEQTRQEKLREAADAESRAKQLELQSQLIEGKMERKLAEAEARAETATVLAQQAERVQEERRAAQLTAEAEREMADMYGESEQRHADTGSALDRVGMPPASAEAAEMMRRQRERFASPEYTVAPTVPVDEPPEPVEVPTGPSTPYTTSQVQEMLAQAPKAPTIPKAQQSGGAASSSAMEADETQRVPVAA